MQAFRPRVKEINLSIVEPKPKIRGIGVSDSIVYAKYLSEKYNYTNTFLHQDPCLNIEESDSFAKYLPIDFIVCSDVIEHTLAPPGELIPKLFNALRPGGCLILSAPTYELDHHIEKYPSLASIEVVKLPDSRYKIVGKTSLGKGYEDIDPLFHGGAGQVLEMRILSHSNLLENLVNAGFLVSEAEESILRRYGGWWPSQEERQDIPQKAVGKVLICKKPMLSWRWPNNATVSK